MSEDDDDDWTHDPLKAFLDQILVALDSAAARAVVVGMSRKLFLKFAGQKFDWVKNLQDSDESKDGWDVDDEELEK